MLNRVVVTGLGVVSPIGTGKDNYAKGLFSGLSGVERITLFDASQYTTRIAAEVKDFHPYRIIPCHLLEQTDRFAHFAMAAAKEAVDGAGLAMEEEDPLKVGVLIGTGRGGMSAIEEMYRLWQDGRENFCGTSLFAKYFPGSAATAISIMLGARGPNNTVMAACASGTIAIGNAFRILQQGGADVVIAGGCEAPLAPGLLAGACATRAMSTCNDDPRRACRPFDLDRDGYVMGEGAGVVVLETLAHARERGARVYGEIAGYGVNSDAYHITSPLPDGTELARAMNDALQEAGLEPSLVDYLNAHGSSTVLNDRYETRAIKKVFGPHAYQLAVSSTKSMTGHMMGAAGAVEFIACLLALEHHLIPPTINYENPDPECDLDYVSNRARKKELHITMSNSSGFGGHNASIVVKKQKALSPDQKA